jgi:hypothetical protein
LIVTLLRIKYRCIMSTLIVNPDSKEKLTIIKAFLKAMKISFIEEKPSYSSDFVAKIRQGDEDIKSGRTKKINLDEICK